MLDFFSFIVYWLKKALWVSVKNIIKSKFHKHKVWISINKVDIKIIELSEKESHGNKDSYK